jgi:uncharacterized integral membrane protein (TIGR02327 family)
MKMVIILNYKTYLYVIFVLLSTYALSGVNFDKIMKSNHPLEARIIVILLSFITGYLITNFIVDFISVSKIL